MMDYSRKISQRLWNLPEKGEQESHREETFIDDIVQKSFIERKLLENLDGVETVFDGGAGSGRFSILLARHGCKVTHFDISQPCWIRPGNWRSRLACWIESPLSRVHWKN